MYVITPYEKSKKWKVRPRYRIEYTAWESSKKVLVTKHLTKNSEDDNNVNIDGGEIEEVEKLSWKCSRLWRGNRTM